jgi:CRP-like cAMP-binding protein
VDQDSFRADEQLFKALAVRCETTICNEGCSLFKQGTEPRGIFLVIDGEASLVMLSPAGQITWSFRAGPGSVLGLPAAVGKAPYTLTAFVRRGSVVGFVSLADLSKLLQEQPSLYPSVLTILASEVRAARAAFATLESNPFSLQSETRCRRTDKSWPIV